MAKRKLKGITVIYLSKKCPHCQKVYESRNEIRAIFLNLVEELSFRWIEDDRDFIAKGFERVPTLILPTYRPFEAISPEILMNEDYIKQMIEGVLLPEDVLHITEIKRRQHNIVLNEKLNKLLGGELWEKANQ